MRPIDVVIVGGGPAGVACAITCARQGQNTVLLEKGMPGRHKVCGGVMPSVCNLILQDDLGLKIPEGVMCAPQTLGLFYVPPSGRKSGASMRSYRLLNVNRDRFDQWLCREVENSGAKVHYGTEFEEFEAGSSVKVRVRNKDGIMELESRFLVGADGVFSKVRKQLYPISERNVMMIMQELWQATGEFDQHFYTFLREEVTPTYGYVIPKDGFLLIGTGVLKGHPVPVAKCLQRFKGWLRREFAFEPVSLKRTEGGSIPYNSLFAGEGNIILVGVVGDAAGFCNPFSGEGIRLGMESGIMAAESVQQASEGGKTLSGLYNQQVSGLNEFIRNTYEFSISLTDEEREKFVSQELQRRSFVQS